MTNLIGQAAQYAYLHRSAKDADVGCCVSEIRSGMERGENIEAQLGMFRSYAGCPPYADGPYLTPQLEKLGFETLEQVKLFYRDASLHSIRRIIQDARGAMTNEIPDAPMIYSPGQRIGPHLLAIGKIDNVEYSQSSGHRAQVLSECGTSPDELVSLDQDFQHKKAARPARSLPPSLRS